MQRLLMFLVVAGLLGTMFVLQGCGGSGECAVGNCKTCVSGDTSHCEKCTDGYASNAQTTCTACNITKCKNCDFNITKCQACNDGYITNSMNTSCLDCASAYSCGSSTECCKDYTCSSGQCLKTCQSADDCPSANFQCSGNLCQPCATGRGYRGSDQCGVATGCGFGWFCQDPSATSSCCWPCQSAIDHCTMCSYSNYTSRQSGISCSQCEDGYWTEPFGNKCYACDDSKAPCVYIGDCCDGYTCDNGFFGSHTCKPSSGSGIKISNATPSGTQSQRPAEDSIRV